MSTTSFKNIDAYALLYPVHSLDPLICQTARRWNHIISYERKHTIEMGSYHTMEMDSTLHSPVYSIWNTVQLLLNSKIIHGMVWNEDGIHMERVHGIHMDEYME